MTQPLEIGRRYRNSNGEYELVNIDGMWASVRYDNGRETRHLLAALEIHQRNADAGIAAAAAARTTAAKAPTRARPAAAKRRPATPLQASDFRRDVAGTSWRSRDGFGGLIMQQLADRTGRDFRSHAVFRRAQVLYGQPPRFAPSDAEKLNFRKAKFEFRLDDDSAAYGFYVERPDRAMDPSWEWPHFLAALRRPELAEPLAAAMRAHDLRWEVVRSLGEEVIDTRHVLPGQPLAGGGRDLTWAAFADELAAAADDEWLDVRLHTITGRDDALAQGLDLAGRVVTVYQALLPLYDACA